MSFRKNRLKYVNTRIWETGKDNGEITPNLANDFYEYLANKIVYGQVILIENTEVPKNIVDRIKYKRHTKNKGFIPT